MGSRPGNNLLQKCRKKTVTRPKVVGPFPDPAQVGATRTRLPFLMTLNFYLHCHRTILLNCLTLAWQRLGQKVIRPMYQLG
jgi:hypothetical protein